MSRAAVTFGVFLALAHLIVIFAGFFAPYDPTQQNRDYPYLPPATVHLKDSNGQWHLRPFVYALRPKPSDPSRFEEERGEIHPIRFLVAGSPYSIFGWRSTVHLFGVDDQATLFLLGTDQFGRDQYSRLLFGGRISLFAGLLATLLSVGLGATLGGISGFTGGWPDAVIMRIADLFLALPWLYLLFAVRAVLPLQMDPYVAFILIIALIGCVGWAGPSKLVRGVTLSAKERNFVWAAWKFGASWPYLLRKHILPQALPVVLTQASLLVPQYILAEITLSFLGLGIAEPMPSWGNMLSALQQYFVLTSYWWMVLPLMALLPVSLSYYVLANEFQSRVRSQ